MIQRIQSLYLLFAAALLILFLTLGDVWWAEVAEAFPWLTPVALVLAGLTALAALGAIFLYRDRPMQRKAVLAAQWLDLALVLVLVGVLVALSFSEAGGLGPAAASAYLTLLFPFGAYVFLRLARRGVEADIKLVKSMDRIR